MCYPSQISVFLHFYHLFSPAIQPKPGHPRSLHHAHYPPLPTQETMLPRNAVNIITNIPGTRLSPPSTHVTFSILDRPCSHHLLFVPILVQPLFYEVENYRNLLIHLILVPNFYPFCTVKPEYFLLTHGSDRYFPA